MKFSILTLFFWVCCYIPNNLFCKGRQNIQSQQIKQPYHAWFTGPLLTPTPINMEQGHPAIEPSVTIFWNYGKYTDNWGLEKGDDSVTINPYLDFQFALTERTGVELQLQSFTTIKNSKSTTSYADTNILLGYQISNDQKQTWVPDCRFLLEIILPTGKYKGLNPEFNFDDVTGQGAYFIGPNLAFQKSFYFPENVFIFHWSIGYFFPTKTKINGLSLYGGGEGTDGTIRPGQFLTAFIAGEYSLTQRWVIGFESEFLYQLPSSDFQGTPGIGNDGLSISVGIPSSSQLIFLPEIQYNFNATSGLLLGGWFSLIGKNTRAYAAGFLAYLYVF